MNKSKVRCSSSFHTAVASSKEFSRVSPKSPFSICKGNRSPLSIWISRKWGDVNKCGIRVCSRINPAVVTSWKIFSRIRFECNFISIFFDCPLSPWISTISLMNWCRVGWSSWSTVVASCKEVTNIRFYINFTSGESIDNFPLRPRIIWVGLMNKCKVRCSSSSHAVIASR